MIDHIDIHQGEHVTTLLPKAAVTKPLYYVLRDWECSRWAGKVRDLGFTTDGQPRHAVPMVFRLGDINYIDGHYTYLDEDWQFFTFDLLCLSYYGKTHQALADVEYNWIAERWRGLYASKTAFTNRQGADKNRNWVTRKQSDMNKDVDKGIGLYTLVCGGASLTGTPVLNSKGSMMLRVDAFDGTKPPPNIRTINIRTDPRIFKATIITDKKVPGGYIVRKFTYLENPVTGEVRDCLVPIIASEPVYYPMPDLRIVTSGVKPNPYYP